MVGAKSAGAHASSLTCSAKCARRRLRNLYASRLHPRTYEAVSRECKVAENQRFSASLRSLVLCSQKTARFVRYQTSPGRIFEFRVDQQTDSAKWRRAATMYEHDTICMCMNMVSLKTAGAQESGDACIRGDVCYLLAAVKREHVDRPTRPTDEQYNV